MKRALSVILLVLLADQVLKVWVKLTFFYDSALPLFGDWGFLHFIENRGMAFGLEFGGSWGKLVLTVFRILAVAGIGWYLLGLIKKKASTAMLVSVSLIFSGALGNIIDSTFYGLIFSASSPFQKAVLFPPEGGYAPLFHGAVVDMFYFPIWKGRLPDWLPGWGGEQAVFFRPVFNVADAAITVGVALFIMFQRSVKKQVEETPSSEDPTPLPTAPEGSLP